jgi:RNA-directed DNA polymerase
MPLLANIFLHHILDLWAHQWRLRRARGRIVIMRYADDVVMGFETKADADEMLSASQRGWPNLAWRFRGTRCA